MSTADSLETTTKRPLKRYPHKQQQHHQKKMKIQETEEQKEKEVTQKTAAYCSYSPRYFLDQATVALLKCLGLYCPLEDPSNPKQDDSRTSQSSSAEQESKSGAELDLAANSSYTKRPPRPGIRGGRGGRIN